MMLVSDGTLLSPLKLIRQKDGLGDIIDDAGDEDLDNGDNNGRDDISNRYTEAELQQALLGLKREHKESIEQMRKDQDEALFKVGFYPFFRPFVPLSTLCHTQSNPLSDVSGTLCL